MRNLDNIIKLIGTALTVLLFFMFLFGALMWSAQWIVGMLGVM